MKLLNLAMTLTAVLLLGGCAPQNQGGCPAVSATVTAKDDGKSGNGRGATFIRVNPDTVKIRANCNFVLNNPGGHEISTTSATPWLNHPTPTKERLTLGPAVGAEGAELKYTVHVKDIGSLDPRARVIR